MLSLDPNTYLLSEADKAEVKKLVSVLELSSGTKASGTKVIFAVAPEISPRHLVYKQLKEELAICEENFTFSNFFYSQDSFYNFLYRLDDARKAENQENNTGRRVVMIFGIDQLPTPRLVKELQRLNLGREEIFERNLVLIFWVNRDKFFDEFRRRSPDFWDWREKVVNFETGNPLIYPYLEWLITENSYLIMSGVMQVNRQVDIFLDQIYISLQAEWRQQISEISERHRRRLETTSPGRDSIRYRGRGISLDDWDEPYYEPFYEDYPSAYTTKTVTQKVELAQAVREHQYSVILGSPGAGKTTLLRYLALHFAVAKRDDIEVVTVGEVKEELGKTLLPVFFRIADYAERLKPNPELTLIDYLNQHYRQWESHFQAYEKTNSELMVFLLDAMEHGQCLMLLDGLDEVFDQASRKQIVERINQFVDKFPANKYVITSRIAGYYDAKLSGRFAEFTIEDMDSEKVQLFLHRWCRTVEKLQQPDANEEQWQKRGDEQAKEILKAIAENEGVKRLTVNPLLLTILALIHRNGDRLPSRRVRLYDLAVQTLTEDWQKHKKLPDASKALLKQTEVVGMLAPLAYWMHEEKPSGLVTQAEVEAKLAIKLAELNDSEPQAESIRQTVSDFLRKVRETTGLFIERSPEVYSFMHLTFEEYFVARYIADHEQSEILELINKHLHEPRWNEPILLAFGYYGLHFHSLSRKLIEKFFTGLKLESYAPSLNHEEIKIRTADNEHQILIYFQPDADNNLQECEFNSQDLLFAGQVIAEVEIHNLNLRRKLINQLVITYLRVDADFEDNIIKQLLKTLRKIEIFYQKCEVKERLQAIVNDVELDEDILVKAKTAILYIACSESEGLTDYVSEFVNQLEPNLFCSIRNLVTELGEDMTDALENCRYYHKNTSCSSALDFLTAMSYVRKNKYDQAIELFTEIREKLDSHFSAYISWSLATCYQEKQKFDQADEHYQECLEKLTYYNAPLALLNFWQNLGVCYRLHSKYEQALNCFQQMLTISQEINKQQNQALALHHIGKTYQDWGKYEQGIFYYQQSRELYQQLRKDKDVANMWSWLADCYQDWGKYKQAISYHQQSREICQRLGLKKEVANQWYNLAGCYREWGKYQQAVDCVHQDLAIRQQLDDQGSIADAYYQLGRIYQDWSKYEQAVNYFQQSQEIYQQLGREKDVAIQWLWLSDCYREWGKYQQAVDCVHQCLTIRQQLDDQGSIASAYNQLGRIYQAWSNYEQAVNHFQQSQEIYQRLGLKKEVANKWYNLADCYREWGKYQQGVDCVHQCLTIRQQLDNQGSIASAYYQLGRLYRAWSKYEQSVNYFQQSQEIYQQLGREKGVANQWYNLADCYREWGKYQQAVDCAYQDLAIRQQLDDQVNIADTYNQLGRIYQAWSKYEQAVNYFQQSQEIYQQLGREHNVANQWYWLVVCYREWGKYQQAVDCAHQCLRICQQLDHQVNIADAYNQLGRIYQAWSKYEQAVNYFQQSQEIYQQLGREKGVANQWYNLADCYREWGKYQQAVDCAHQDLAIRQQLDDQDNIADSYYQLGRIYQAWSNYEQAVNYFQQSQEIYQQLGREHNVANQWYWLAGCYREWGKYQQAVDCVHQCLTIRQQLDDQGSIASAYFQLGWIYQAWSKYEQAVNYFQQSQEIYQQLGREKGVANQWYNLAGCYREWGKYQQAVDCVHQCLTIRQQLDDQGSIADAYYQLGRIYQDWNKYEQAVNYLQQSQEIYQQLGREKDVANQWYWLALSYRDWGKYQQALDCQLQCLKVRQKLGNDAQVALSYCQLAWIYQAWSKYEQAVNYFQQSQEIYQQIGQENNIANLWYNLAVCYREWGKYQQAIDCVHQCLTIRQQLDDQGSIANAYFQLGWIYQAWSKYEQAINYFQQSKDIYQQLGREKDVAIQWLWLASCYREWGKYQQAVDCVHQCLTVRQQLDDQGSIASAYNQLGWIYRDWKKYEQAVNYFQESLALYQQLGKNEIIARCLRRIANCQRLLVKNNLNSTETFDLLAQAEENVHQAIEINNQDEYQSNLAYDYIILSLIYSERLRLLPCNDSSIPAIIKQFEESYQRGFSYLDDLGQILDKAEEALDIARVYLEVEVVANLQLSEKMTQECLKVFQEYNRSNLIAAAYKLLGEIYQKHSQANQAGSGEITMGFLNQSLQIYRDLDLQEKVAEVEKLIFEFQ